MIPKEKIPEEVKGMREQALLERRTSNHPPGDGFKLCPIIPKYTKDPINYEILLKKINS